MTVALHGDSLDVQGPNNNVEKVSKFPKNFLEEKK